MTVKKAILIGLLSATIIGLVAYGIKHKSFTKENLTKTYTRSAIKVNADSIYSLSNTTWTLNDEVTWNNLIDEYGEIFKINFTSNNTNFTEIDFHNSNADFEDFYIQYYADGNYTTIPFNRSFEEYTEPPFTLNFQSNTYNANYKTIHIIDGQDVTNQNLVGWLQLNSTNVAPPTEITQEVIDIRGLMLTILTMPFTFITQAFNVTLWAGTEYQLNISNFIIAIISIMALLFIIKLFTSGFNILGNYTNSRADTKLKKEKIKTLKANRESNKKE